VKTLYRPARREDARAVAELFAIAGEGVPEYLWSLQARHGQSPIEVGIERAQREGATLSYQNATLAERDGDVVAMLLGQILPQPTPADIAALDTLPPVQNLN
jgi:hypothetical protein